MRYSLLIALRSLPRRGRRLSLLAMLVALGIAGLVATASLASAVEGRLIGQAKGLLGADVELTGATAAQLATLVEQGGEVQELYLLPTLVRVGDRQAMAQLRAVDPLRYPFYGELELDLATLLADGGAVVEASLAAQLDIEVGDQLDLGFGPVRVSGLLSADPNSALTNPLFGPPILVDLAADLGGPLDRLAGTQRRALVRLPSDQPVSFTAFDSDQIRHYDQVAAEVANGLQTGRLALTLAALVSLALAAVGIAGSVAAFVAEATEEVAVYKSLGFSGWQVFTIFLSQLLLTGLLGSLLGLGLGLLLTGGVAQLIEEGFGLPLSVGTLQASNIALALGLGLGSTLLAALPPLAHLIEVRPQQLLRPSTPAQRRLLRWLLGFFTLVGFTGLAAWLSGSGPITFAVLNGLGGLALILFLLSSLLLTLLGRLRLPWLPWRFARRCLPSTPAATTALAIGAFLLAGLALLQGSLISSMATSDGGAFPNLFVLQVPPERRAELRHQLEQTPEVDVVLSPFALLSAALSDGQSALVMESDGITAEEIVEGRWFSDTAWGQPQVVLRASQTSDWGYTIGDQITLFAGGFEQTFEVIGFWKPSSSGLRLDAPLIVAPGSLKLPGLSYVLPIKTSTTGAAAVQRQLVADFPGVLPVSLADVTTAAAGILDQTAAILRYITFLALIAGSISVASAVAAAGLEKQRDAALLKALGAGRRELIAKQAVENFTQGLVAGLTGASFALLLLSFLQRLLSGVAPPPGLVLQTLSLWPLLSGLLAAGAGLLAVVGILNQSPLLILRNEN